MTTFRLSSFWLTSTTLRSVLAALDAQGEARVVGGAVRNTLLGRPLGDIDIATTLVPERVARIARRAGFSVHETGLAHGTLTVVADGQPFEVTTLREDVSTDGRRASVRFTEDWALDAGRRDFTMNALYVDAGGTGYDYVDGHDDCLAGLVRFIGDPTARILEDHLRILRFFRFHAGYGKGEIDPEGLAAVVANKACVVSLPAERVQHEFSQLLAAEGAIGVIDIMAAHDIMGPYFGRPIDADCFRAFALAEATAGRSVSAALGYLALVAFDPEAFADLADRLKFSRRMRNRAAAALEAAQDMPPRSVPHVRGLLYEHGPEAFTDGLMIARARGAEVVDVAMLLQEARRWTRPRFPVGGYDLLEQGGESGAALGERLALLEKLWRESDFSLSREALLALDRERVAGSAMD